MHWKAARSIRIRLTTCYLGTTLGKCQYLPIMPMSVRLEAQHQTAPHDLLLQPGLNVYQKLCKQQYNAHTKPISNSLAMIWQGHALYNCYYTHAQTLAPSMLPPMQVRPLVQLVCRSSLPQPAVHSRGGHTSHRPCPFPAYPTPAIPRSSDESGME